MTFLLIKSEERPPTGITFPAGWIKKLSCSVFERIVVAIGVEQRDPLAAFQQAGPRPHHVLGQGPRPVDRQGPDYVPLERLMALKRETVTEAVGKDRERELRWTAAAVAPGEACGRVIEQIEARIEPCSIHGNDRVTVVAGDDSCLEPRRRRRSSDAATRHTVHVE